MSQSFHLSSGELQAIPNMNSVPSCPMSFRCADDLACECFAGRLKARGFHEPIDVAVAVQRLADKKPFSKGVIRHFWAAVRSDDPVKLFKTLYSEDMVRRADYAIYRENRLPGDLVSRPLMDLLTKGGHPLVPDGGAQRCAAALREKYSVAV